MLLLNTYHEQLTKAAELYNFVNLTTKHVIPTFHFGIRQAMVDAGIPDSLAASQRFTNKFNEYMYAVMNRNRYMSFDLPTSENIIVSNMQKILKILHPHIPLEAMHIFTLAGFNLKVKKTDDGKVDRKDYDRVVKRLRRALKTFKDLNPPVPTPAPVPVSSTPTFPNHIQTLAHDAIHGRTIEVHSSSDELSNPLSPMTASQRTSTEGDSSTISSITQGLSIQTSHGPTSTITSQRQRGIISTINSSSNSSSTDIFGHSIPRQTSMQTQSSRRYTEKEKRTRTLGFKIGTTLLDEKLKGNNLVTHLQSEDEIADGINRLLGIDVICGSEIKKAVAQNRVGLGPQSKGRPTELPREDIEDLAILFFSISSIEQANATSRRLKRPQLISLLDQIVNDKRKREGKKEIDATHLYKYHIEPLNSLRQDMNPVDRREFIRVLWLTYKNLKQNYSRWKDACIQEGFARLSETEEEFQEHGQIVFFDGKFSNKFMSFDEMQLSLDQNSERPGGRPADTPTNPSISDPGSGEYKSGTYCTIVASIVGNEPGIPMFIFPTQAKSGQVNVYPKRLESFPQIHAKYGNTFARWYDVNLQFSPKGSMTSTIMGHWVHGFSEYYPDVADVEGKRVMVKSDFGPGRLKNEEFMNSLLVDGFKFFASLPNGTEITAEMDQLFSEFKRLCYLNRDQLFEVMVSVYGQKAKLTLEHVGYIVFGGEVEIKVNHRIAMKYKPFVEAFTKEKIMSAREKTGYWPFTQNALKSKKVRHVLRNYEQSTTNRGDDNTNDSTNTTNYSSSVSSSSDEENNEMNQQPAEDFFSSGYNESDSENDVQEELLQSIEDLNIRTVSTLVAKGYLNVAGLGVRKLQREPTVDNDEENEEHGNRTHIVRTEPNTQERQDQLAAVKTAGEFHRVTMGGGILNCSDMMIGLARKRMKKDIDSMEKEKKAIQSYEKIEEQARSKVFCKLYTKWTAKDFKVAIKYKQGVRAPADRKWNQSSKLDALKEFYEEHYKGRARLGPDKIHWKVKDETKLEDMKAGKIDSVEETVMYGRCLEGRRNYLVERLLNISAESRFNIIEDIVVLLTPEERTKLGFKLGFILPDGSESEEEEGDGYTSNTSFASAPIPLLLTEIIDEQQQSSNQGINDKEKNILQFDEDSNEEDEELYSENRRKKNEISQLDNEDDYFSDQSSETNLFESLVLEENSDDDTSGSSSCFDFGDRQQRSSPQPPEANESCNLTSSPDILTLPGVVVHTALSDDVSNNAVSERQKEVGSIVDGNDSSTYSAVDVSKENDEEDSSDEESLLWVRLSQITTEKNGLALIQDELNARGMKYKDQWKIRKLKSVLINEGLDGEKEFEPKSSLIIQAIKDESI